MPQLDVLSFPPQLIWLAITFIVLYLVLARAGLPRVERILERRRGTVQGDIERAGRMKAEAEAVIQAYERALAEARAEAQIVMRDLTERLNAEAAQRLAALSGKLAEETAAAERRIADAKTQALGNLRTLAVDVARAACAKLIGGEVDAGRAQSAVDAVLKERAG